MIIVLVIVLMIFLVIVLMAVDVVDVAVAESSAQGHICGFVEDREMEFSHPCLRSGDEDGWRRELWPLIRRRLPPFANDLLVKIFILKKEKKWIIKKKPRHNLRCPCELLTNFMIGRQSIKTGIKPITPRLRVFISYPFLRLFVVSHSSHS